MCFSFKISMASVSEAIGARAAYSILKKEVIKIATSIPKVLHAKEK